MDVLMTVFDAAKFMQVHPVTLRRLAREGKITGCKIGRDWRFNKQTILNQVDRTSETPQWPLDEKKMAPITVTGTSTANAYAALLRRNR